jgi:exopolyphosphatase/guanosine-5'-triphosphate,3'-diphosphate pyrophosphatase
MPREEAGVPTVIKSKIMISTLKSALFISYCSRKKVLALWAVMDIGTNSSRLLVADCEQKTGKIKAVKRALQITRIGAGMNEENRLISLEAMTRTVQALMGFSLVIKQYPVKKVFLLATQAVREADNQEELVEKIKTSLGWNLQIISGEEEARLSYLGAVQGLVTKGVPVVIDIGGGSTEFILQGEKQDFQIRSFPLGALRVWENPLADEKIQELLQKGLQKISFPSSISLVGVGGTVTTVAALKLALVNYDAEKVQGLKLTISEIKAFYEKLKVMQPGERLRVPGITPGREDIIVSGLQILINLMSCCGKKEIIVSEQDLLYGVICAKGLN